jgi:hypothetical protein
MEMIGNQRPCVTERSTLSHNPGQSIHKIITVIIAKKKFLPFYPPTDDML